jgi:hypothetical protein
LRNNGFTSLSIRQRKKERNKKHIFVVVVLKGIIGYGLWDYKPLEYDGYIYPMWANVLGWCIAGSSIAMIPTVAIYQILITPGTFCQVRSRIYVGREACTKHIVPSLSYFKKFSVLFSE